MKNALRNVGGITEKGVVFGLAGAIVTGLLIVLDRAFLSGVDREDAAPPAPPVN